jgi:hypothetical protein
MKTLLFAASALALSLTGCVSAKYHREVTAANGTKTVVDGSYSSPAFGVKMIESADFDAGLVKGVRSEQSSIAEVIAQATAAGVAIGQKTVKP